MEGRRDLLIYFLVIFFFLSAISLPSIQAMRNVPYRAAVYEHAVLSAPAKVVTRSEAVENMMKNIRIYENQTKIAAEQGAQIIVFPEYGILGIYVNRTTVKSYLEEVPDPRHVSWNPSESPDAYKGTDIQQQLSRIAKENTMYMVVNMGTKVPCKRTDDPLCPDDGQYQYNTNVVYSDKGLLVAVYHKRNLYIDLPFDPAREPEYVTFDTPFGRFGTVICFDLMFKEPTFLLLDKYKVRNLAYPTAWVKIIPFFRSMMVHSGFARAYKINILAADLHATQHLAHGSGLYTPEGAKAFFYTTAPKKSKLLIADMPAISEETPLPVSSIPSKINPDKNVKIVKGSVLGLGIRFRPLPDDKTKGVTKVCDGDFCCSLEYDRQPSTERYALGVINGFIHVIKRKLYMQTCSLSKCDGDKCGTDITSANTIFNRFVLTGHNFKSGHISPRVVAMNESNYVYVDDEWTYNYTGHIYMEGPMSLPLHSAVLNGRVYDNDPPYPTQVYDKDPPYPTPTPGGTQSTHGSQLGLLVVISYLLFSILF